MTADSGLVPVRLRCNALRDPLALRAGAPTLSWSLRGPGRVGPQRAYRVLVAGDERALADCVGDVWDSGTRDRSKGSEVLYDGPELESLQRYFWKVRIWTESEESAWSDPATFETGLGRNTSWSGSWIAWDEHAIPFEAPTEQGPVDPVALGLLPSPHFRREFAVASDLLWARLFVTARGLYEARLNGERVGDALLAPGWTDYAVRMQYEAYDVTGMLRPGSNALGVVVGDGWYSGFFGPDPKRRGAHYGDHPELLAELHLRYASGASDTVVTDRSWKGNWGTILHADPLMGELQCSGLSPDGWDAPGFDDRGWHAVVSRSRDGIPIVADPGPAARVSAELTPHRITPVGEGKLIVDFGQNLTGWVRLSVSGPGGRAIRLRHGEMLDEQGRLYVDNLRTARQTDEFWTSGGAETFEPHFTWHGFRYVEISGYPGTLDAGDVRALVVHSDIEGTGRFECSDPVVNQLHSNVDWGLRGNFLSVPTDCPQRDERLGWLGDAQIFARTAAYLRDVQAFFDKWLDDVMDAQLDSGAFTDTAPVLGARSCGAPAWADAGVILPWTLLKMYGTLRPAARCYAAMTRWMEFLSRANPGHLRCRELGNNYGDWLAPQRDCTPPELLATAYWAYDAVLMGDMADALGHDADARHYRELARKIQDAFADSFVDDRGRVASETQTAYSLALAMHLVPPALRSQAADHLVEAIRCQDWHLSTGFVGVSYLLPALSSNGHSDVAHRLLGQESRPSWRYPIRQGATTIWERWDGWTVEGGFQSPHMNSFNHYALGSVGEWLYRFVAGIDQPADSIGFDRVAIRPHPGPAMERAGATFHSVHGPISTRWKRGGDTLILEADIPPGVAASIHLPSTDPEGAADEHENQPHAVDVFCGHRGIREAVFEVESGSHRIVGEYAVDHPVSAD